MNPGKSACVFVVKGSRQNAQCEFQSKWRIRQDEASSMQHAAWGVLTNAAHLKTPYLSCSQDKVAASRGQGNGRRRSRVRLNEGQGGLLATG